MCSWLKRACATICFWCGISTHASAFVDVGDSWRYLTGDQPAPNTNWTLPGFDDRTWSLGPGGFGTGYGIYEEATVIPGLPGAWTSVRFRREFIVPDLPAVRWLTLRVNYADGFLAALNGVEVARRNLPGDPGSPVDSDVPATAVHDRSLVELVDLTPFIPQLQPGTNVLAVQAHNLGTNDTNFSMTAELLGNVLRGPYLQNASSNRITLVWATPVPAEAWVDFGTGGQLDRRVADTNLVTDHEFILSGLDPGTEYAYRIGSRSADGRSVSETGQFRTLRFSGAISFAIVGDTGSGQTPQRQIAEVLRTQAVDLVVHLGDVIYPYFTEGWVDSRCLSAYRRQMREVPWFFALGNHDLLAGPQDFLRTFRSPTNDVPAAVHAVAGTSPEHYYSFDHGDAHFAVLFQPYAHQYLLREGDPQYGWLTNDLARTSKPWRLILLHHPLQTSGNHRFDDIDASGIRDCTEVRNVLLPVAQRYGVQAIFAGHDHNFERFIPTNGVQTFVLGGGGIASYPLVERDVGTAQFYQLHHCARVTIDGPDLRLEALGTNGAVFDWMTLRLAPSEVELGAEWHTPSWPAGEPSNGDNNRVGQIFDFRGPARAAVAGDFSNLGEFHANHDGTNLFVGFSQSMLYGDSTIFLFLEVPRLSGVTSLAGLGDGILDPLGEGADGLDFLTNLTFEGWAPAIACLIGDEMADAPDRGHRRPAAAFSSGQGVFRLDDAFHDVSGVRLQQFDRSPQVGGGSSDTSADFSEVSIPLSELGGLQPGDVVRVGAVVGRPAFTGQPAVPGWELDRGFLGAQISGGGTGQIVLRGLAVRLGPNPDPDADGLTTNEEIVLGTDPGKPDTDTDGLLDGWEVRFAFDPLSAAGAGEAGEDADNDGMTNIDEQSAGTDPRDPGSRLVLIAIPEEPDRLVLLWGAVPGLRYQVQESSEAASGGFADVLPAPRTATGTLEAYEVNLAPPGGGNRFYRIRLVP